MVAYAWVSLMEQWNRALLACPPVTAGLPPQVLQSGWLGFPPATDEQINRAEARLGAVLPPSYRQFLKTTNGWRTIGNAVGPLWSAEEVGWLRVRDPRLIADWTEGILSQGPIFPVPDEDYFVYGEAQHAYNMRPEYLETALEVSGESPVDAGIFLLNPRVVSTEGEWEAWFLAPWLAGAARFRSFFELMEAEWNLFERGRSYR